VEPVRIKYYGVVWLTKKAYLVGTAVTGALAAFFVVLCVVSGRLPPFSWPWEPRPAPHLTGVPGAIYNHVWDFLLVGIVLEAIDILVTMRTFARKEAERRASASAGDPLANA
jgi:hypothetical protein